MDIKVYKQPFYLIPFSCNCNSYDVIRPKITGHTQTNENEKIRLTKPSNYQITNTTMNLIKEKKSDKIALQLSLSL